MRTRVVFAFARALLVLAICSACGGGGGGGSTGGSTSAPDTTVALTWRSSDADVAGYVVHWGTAARAYSHDVDVSEPSADAEGNVTVVIALDGGDPASRYYFAITSYDAGGNSSGYSNELSTDGASAP